jgi:hypothetical protein
LPQPTLLQLRVSGNIRVEFFNQKAFSEIDDLFIVFLETGLAAVVRVLHLFVLAGAIVPEEPHYLNSQQQALMLSKVKEQF